MKKSLIIASFLTVLIVPSVTLAAWYNPLSWFKKPVTVQIETPVVETSVIATTTPEVKPVPPVSTFSNNITVADPKLQGQINTLQQTNTQLQIKLASLTNEYNALVTQNSNLSSQISDAKVQVATLQTQNNSLSQRPSFCPATTDSIPTPSQKSLDVTLPEGNVYWDQSFKIGVVVHNDNGQATSDYPIIVTVNGQTSEWNDPANVYVQLPWGKNTFTVSVPKLGLLQSFTMKNIAAQ